MGSNQVDLGGMRRPASLTAMSSSVPVAKSENATPSVPARRSSSWEDFAARWPRPSPGTPALPSSPGV